jgi:hypothetical protein
MENFGRSLETVEFGEFKDRKDVRVKSSERESLDMPELIKTCEDARRAGVSEDPALIRERGTYKQWPDPQ